MNNNLVDMYLIANAKNFHPYHVPYIREALIKLDDNALNILHTLNLRDPSNMLIVSIVGGAMGIDRITLGETGLGILKLITCGGFGIWHLVDLFLISNKTKDVNMEALNLMLANLNYAYQSSQNPYKNNAPVANSNNNVNPNPPVANNTASEMNSANNNSNTSANSANPNNDAPISDSSNNGASE
jgi:hypothetical protein